MNSETLKPCPFCGSGNIDAEAYDDNEQHYVCCMDCFAGTGIRGERGEVIAAWNTRADPIPTDDSELLTIAWMDGSHRSTKAHRDTIKALEAEVERLREALERIATVDMGGGFLGAAACQKVARTALEASNG